MIEKARHQRFVPDRQHRVCPFCPTEVEDEIHFLIKCTKYDTRDDLFNDIENKVPNFHALNDKQKFIYMMTMEDEVLMHKIVHSVHDWLEIRVNTDPLPDISLQPTPLVHSPLVVVCNMYKELLIYC